MATNIPAKLKGADITQFAIRAQQLDKFKPIISYWLRFFITQRIISKGLHLADEECTAYTTNLMEQLEQTKAAHSTEDALLDEVAAYAYCEQFALEIFEKADKAVRGNRVTNDTVDTFRAATTFLELLSIWRNPPEPEIASKLKYAKFHTLRIVKALKAGEDPNLSNPVQEAAPQPISPPRLDPSDPDVQNLIGASPQPPARNPYQPYVETAPNTSQPSPTFSASRVSPPPNLPSAPAGYSHPTSPPTFPQHPDVSPISQPETSRKGSEVSVGGGYFPRVDVPTFTADDAAPGLPTAPSMEDEPMTSPLQSSHLPQAPQAPQAHDAQSYYQNPAPAPPAQQPSQPPPLTQPTFQYQHPGYTTSPPPPSSQQHTFQPSHAPPQSHYQYPPQPPQPPPQQFAARAPPVLPHTLHQGPFKTDEEAMLDAQKHAKWAISALNFEDVNTAVKELRIALKALGAD